MHPSSWIIFGVFLPPALQPQSLDPFEIPGLLVAQLTGGKLQNLITCLLRQSGKLPGLVCFESDHTDSIAVSKQAGIFHIDCV